MQTTFHHYQVHGKRSKLGESYITNQPTLLITKLELDSPAPKRQRTEKARLEGPSRSLTSSTPLH
jgi:hypothetical protein